MTEGGHPNLMQRDKLPEALRVLLDDYPRDAWEAHPNFSGLVQFWLERHLGFRQLMEVLRTDAEAVMDRRMDIPEHAPRLSRFGGMLVTHLHGHHQIEDAHYFPTLIKLDNRLERGFDMLDSDHHALGDILDRFTGSANSVLQSMEDEANARELTAGFLNEVTGLERMLNRHLSDEEDIIVPVILKTGGGGLS